MDAAGACYVARWTVYHVKQLAKAMSEVLAKPGFGFVEVISPCPTLYQRRNRMGDGLTALQYYKQASKIKNGAPTSELGITKQGEIVVGKFIDRDRPNYLELMRNQMRETLGDRYVDTLHMEECV
jgi:2-oxoglutarate ferredoxin oxidoreductase subunit beta